MIFFADENVPVRAVRMLEIFDGRNEIRALEDYFDRGTQDLVWMPAIATWDPKPVVLAGDGRILRNPAEQVCLRDSNLMFVCLAKGWTTQPWNEWAWKIIKVWPDIVRNVEKHRDPTVFEVAVSSLKVERKFKTADLRTRRR